MYPVVFSQTASGHSRTMPVAFIGFCVLSVLLAVYLGDRQLTVRRLRQQIGEERRRSSDALRQATADLVAPLASSSSFHHQRAIDDPLPAPRRQHRTPCFF